MAEGEGRWSIWYNRDRPWIGDGDYETVELIEQNFGPICPRGQKIVSSVCRLTRFMEEFTQSTSGRLDDHLQIPCTTQGLLCLNDQQQGGSGHCHDYDIKFLCRDSTDGDDTEEGSPFPQFDVRIYIILAVVPILIFLIRILWAYVFRRRRNQRRSAGRGRRRRGRPDRDTFDDDNSSIASSLANPPPSYKELFGETGPNRSSVFAISGRNIPICQQCKEASCSVVTALRDHPENNNNDDDNNDMLQHEEESAAAAATAATTIVGGVSRSTSNSTALTSVASRIGSISSISSNLDSPADILPPPPFSSSSSSSSSSQNPHFPACSGGAATAVDISNSTQQNIITAISISSPSARGVDVDIERPEPSATQSIINAATATTDSSAQSDLVVVPSTMDMEDETNTTTNNSNRSDSNNDNNRDNDTTHHVTAIGLSHNVQLTQQQQPILTPLSTRNGPNQLRPSHSKISDPCACTCHRTVPYKGRELAGYDNPGFHHESSTHSSTNALPSTTSTRVPQAGGIHRVWSNLSTGSTLTLSELPTYQDALELIKKKEAEAMQTSN